MLLRNITPAELDSVCKSGNALDAGTLASAQEIIDRVRNGGQRGLEACVAEFDGWEPGRPLHLGPEDFAAALGRIPVEQRQLLERTADRIRFFAARQLEFLQPLDVGNCGVRMGFHWQPLGAAGCYVPGGRYPLVSSLLMTAVTARVAGVKRVWVACPVAGDLMLAAAAICQVDGFLVAGGAHAIAALTYGVGPVPVADVVVGPGNRWVTAAKQLVSCDVKIDMLAGPSELVVLADETADAAIVAADLLAQAEHDSHARPILVTTSEKLLESVEKELAGQLEELATGVTAREALSNGFAVLVKSVPEGVEVCRSIAPEHLELQVAGASQIAEGITGCGCVFIGSTTGEVFGDYGAGPNHVLPTGGTARFASGLSVMTFLRTQTWLQVEDLERATQIIDDAMQLARMEGLEGHFRSAALRANDGSGRILR